MPGLCGIAMESGWAKTKEGMPFSKAQAASSGLAVKRRSMVCLDRATVICL